MTLLFLATARMAVVDGKFLKVHRSKSSMENGYWLSSRTVAIVRFYVYINSHKSNLSVLIPPWKPCGAFTVTKCGHFSKSFWNHSTHGWRSKGWRLQFCVRGGVKVFKRPVSGLLWASAGFISIALWAFLLAGSRYQPQRLHQRRSCHSAPSRKDPKIYRVCLRAQGQTEGLRLSALLGEAADLAAVAATESTAGSTYTSVSCACICSAPTQTPTRLFHTLSFM